MFKGMSPYAERKDYGKFFKDVYVTRVLSFMQPIKDDDKLIFPKRKSMNGLK